MALNVNAARLDGEPYIEKVDGDKIIALAGNPNVGKSTVFNALTGLHQHTATVMIRQRQRR